MNQANDEAFMRLAIDEARAALEHDDVPIGAVIVSGARVVASARNERQLRTDPVAHAEILALQAAAAELGTRHLTDATMYVTLEPCPMCAGAAVLARLGRLVFGAWDPRAGAVHSLYNVPQDPRLNHSVEITAGVLEADCAALLTGFFATRRGDPVD